MPQCAFKTCRNNARKSNVSAGVSYFRFPNNPFACAKWVSIVARERGNEFYRPAKNSVICSEHFDKLDISGNTNRRRLVKTAVPKLQIQPSPEDLQLPTSEDQQIAAPNTQYSVSDTDSEVLMPRTPAERQKKYRERLKRTNPTKYDEMKKKTAESALRLYYKKKLSQYTEADKIEQRKKWQEEGKRQRQKQAKQDEAKMPLTPAERQKKYRERLKRTNPTKYDEMKKKNNESALRYYKKKVSQYTEADKIEQRKKWQEERKRQRQKQAKQHEAKIKPTPRSQKGKIEADEDEIEEDEIEEEDIKLEIEDIQVNESLEKPDSSNDSFPSEPQIFYQNDPLVQPSKSGYQNVTEFDAVGINVAKKLAKMDPNQAILAESIINNVLRRGLLDKLAEETDLCDIGCGRVKYTLDNRILLEKS